MSVPKAGGPPGEPVAEPPKEKAKGLTRHVSGFISRVLPGGQMKGEGTGTVATPTKPLSTPPKEEQLQTSEMAKSVKAKEGLKATLTRQWGKLFVKGAAAKAPMTDEKCQANINKLLTFLKGKGYDHEGIFRLSGTETVITELMKKLESDPHATVADTGAGVHDAVVALKRTFKQVPFDKNFGYELIKIGSESKIDLKAVKKLPLTEIQRQMLDDLIDYAKDVAKHGDKNQMSARTVAQIIGTLFTPKLEAPAGKALTKDEMMALTTGGTMIQEVFQAIIETRMEGTAPFKFSKQ